MVAASHAHGRSPRVAADLPRDAICRRLPLAQRDGVGGAPVEEREVPRYRVAQHGAQGDAAADRLVQRAQLGDVREEGGGQPPLRVQLDNDPPRRDVLRARRRSPRRAGPEAGGPCRMQARDAGRRAACVVPVCVRARAGEGGREGGRRRLRELVHDQLPPRLDHRIRVEIPWRARDGQCRSGQGWQAWCIRPGGAGVWARVAATHSNSPSCACLCSTVRMVVPAVLTTCQKTRMEHCGKPLGAAGETGLADAGASRAPAAGRCAAVSSPAGSSPPRSDSARLAALANPARSSAAATANSLRDN
jgi:hypothetical protein